MKDKTPQVAAHAIFKFNLAGPTGLEPEHSALGARTPAARPVFTRHFSSSERRSAALNGVSKSVGLQPIAAANLRIVSSVGM